MSLPRNHFKGLTLKVAWCFNLPWFCMNSCRFGGQFKFSSNKQNLLSECIDIQIQPNLGLGKTSVISRLQSLIQFHDCKVAGCKLIRKDTYIFCSKNCFGLYWEKNVLVIKKKHLKFEADADFRPIGYRLSCCGSLWYLFKSVLGHCCTS